MKHIWIPIILAASLLATACQSFVPPAPHVSVAVKSSADVIVVGSSVAGFAAAIASAREGADTILVTETYCVGGQASCAGVATWDGTGTGLDAWFRYGLEQEYSAANVRLGGCYSSDGLRGVDTFVSGDNFCPHPQRVGDEMLSWLNQYGVTLVGPVNVLSIGTDGTVTTVDGVMKADIVIEATETGELIPAALRREVDPACKQQVTWVAGIREPGVGGDLVEDLRYPTDPDYMALLADWWSSPKYHWAGLTGEVGLPLYRRSHDLNGEVVVYLNWMNDAVTASESRDKTMQMLVFLADHGYGEWRYGIRPIPYVRTSDYRLNGQTHLGVTPRGVDSFPDSVMVGNYRTDNHGAPCAAVGATVAESYGAYDVPMGIGVSASRVPVLVAMPRSGDISDLRATSLRMQPDEFGFGEAMGILAAISSKKGILPQDVPASLVRDVIVRNNGVVDVG